jgi:hypothetical protein
MQGSRLIVVTVVGLFAAAVSAGTFTERGSGSGGASSVRLLVLLTGTPPAQQHGVSPARREALLPRTDRPVPHLRGEGRSS